MTRKTAREIAMRLVFELDFHPRDGVAVVERGLSEEGFQLLNDGEANLAEFPDKDSLEYIGRVVRGVDEHMPELDGYIEKYSTGWKFSRISRAALAILRVAMFELVYMPQVPYRVAINEAVELAKCYEDDNIPPFINGILGSYVRGEEGK